MQSGVQPFQCQPIAQTLEAECREPQCFDKQSGFDGLLRLTRNLLDFPWKPQLASIRTETGFFQHRLRKLRCFERLLNCIGYELSAARSEFLLTARPDAALLKAANADFAEACRRLQRARGVATADRPASSRMTAPLAEDEIITDDETVADDKIVTDEMINGQFASDPAFSKPGEPVLNFDRADAQRHFEGLSTTWTCSHCTLDNAMHDSICAACSKTKNATDTPLPRCGKLCGSCQLVNSKDRLRCRACRTSLSTDAEEYV